MFAVVSDFKAAASNYRSFRKRLTFFPLVVPDQPGPGHQLQLNCLQKTDQVYRPILFQLIELYTILKIGQYAPESTLTSKQQIGGATPCR